MPDGLDIVAVWIEKEGGVIALVVGALSGRAVAGAAGLDPGLVKAGDGLPVMGLKGKVASGGVIARHIDEQFVCREKALVLMGYLPPQRVKDRPVEGAALFEVGDPKMNVIDETALVEFHLQALPFAHGANYNIVKLIISKAKKVPFMEYDNARTLQLLHRVVLPLDRALQAADRETGCSAAQLSALGVLIYLKVSTLSALAARERISLATASRIIETMVRSGLVVREIDETDRRAVRLRATGRGQRAVEIACRAREAALADLLGELSGEEWQALGGAARALNRVFGYGRGAD